MSFSTTTLANGIASILGFDNKPTTHPSLDHPLDPLSASELAEVIAIVKSHFASIAPTARVYNKPISLIEPPKKQLQPWLDTWHVTQDKSKLQPLPRKASLVVGVKTETTSWKECVVDIEKRLVTVKDVPTHLHPSLDAEELEAAEAALLANPEFIAAIEKLALPPTAKVVADPWIYGADVNDPVPRYITFMVYLAFGDNPDTNHYASPVPIIPTISADDLSLVDIEYGPIFGTGNKTLLDLDEPFPWEAFTRNEYDADLRKGQGIADRDDIQPYRVNQPTGVSYKLNGRVIQWQRWSLHIGFNFREGLVLNDLRYDGRKTFFRLSMSDMTVPYGDSRSPYHRKQAFDLGDIGAGITANELQLGCDCLGEISYLDWDHVTSTGAPVKMKGVVCIHEEDDGIGWKHTNYRTNKPAVVRSRVLVLQTILTVANYEYIFAWRLDQAGGITLETKATGILSTVAILPGETSPYGNVVSPGVLATNHQHLFCIRIDPAIDGEGNTVVQEDSVTMPFDKANPSKENRYGVGYYVEKTPLEKSGWADAAPEKNRVFKIINPKKTNPISGRPVGYKLVPMPSQLMLAHPDSVAYARAEFGEHHIYVTQHRDGELYAGGEYTNQSNGSSGGIRSWIARGDNVANDDVVVWHTFGLTHNPRVEDFPVMPCETHMLHLKPADFFSYNPAIDVPASTQAFNQSKLHTAQAPRHFQGSAEVENKAPVNNPKPCCK